MLFFIEKYTEVAQSRVIRLFKPNQQIIKPSTPNIYGLYRELGKEWTNKGKCSKIALSLLKMVSAEPRVKMVLRRWSHSGASMASQVERKT